MLDSLYVKWIKKITWWVGCGDSYLEILFCHFNVFRLHAKLHNAAVAVRAHSGKSPDYSYLIVLEPYSCVLGHVTELLFCLNIKLFLPSILQFVEF